MRKLHARVLQLVADRPRTITYGKINLETGISVEWLRAFVSGRAMKPDVNTVEQLYEYLTGNELDI